MSKVKLESKVMDFIHQHHLLSPGEVVVIGVSGGADSVCLLHLLSQRKNDLDVKIHVAHINHELRGVESEADARYVAELAGSFSLPSTIDRRDVAAYKAERGCSMEEAARELRYAFFADVADEVGAKKVAIGHTRDDQVETILMHILRGTGTSGLRGLEPCAPCQVGRGMDGSRPASSTTHIPGGENLLIIRPLLDISREEVLDYCHKHGLSPRTDSSNFSLSFLRNRLRLELLPLLRKYNPNVDEVLLRLAGIARDDSTFIEEQALRLWREVAGQENSIIYLDKARITILPVALQRQLIRLAISHVLGDIRDVEANHIEAVRRLLSKPVGKRLSLPHGLVCQGEYSRVTITTSQSLDFEPDSSSPCPFSPLLSLRAEGVAIPLEVPGETILPGWRVLASIVPRLAASLSLRGTKCRSNLIAEFDLHKTRTELFVCQRQPGDKFQPLGMSMPKKLQRFMVDAKIPLPWRDRIPLVCSPGQIIWVAGYRIDDRVKVTEATREILRLEFIRLS